MDWVSAASLATAAGTLVLAVATFASVRSANRAARAAERSLAAGLRPLLLPSELHDPPQKVQFVDGTWLHVAGGCGAADAAGGPGGVVYLVASLRNAGPGMAVVHGWRFYPDYQPGAPRPGADSFRRQTRDFYVPSGGTGFWQGAFRDPAEPQYGPARAAVAARRPLGLDLLYGDSEGGQRVITRFSMQPRDDGGWLLTASRHWNLDRPDPR